MFSRTCDEQAAAEVSLHVSRDEFRHNERDTKEGEVSHAWQRRTSGKIGDLHLAVLAVAIAIHGESPFEFLSLTKRGTYG